MKALGYLQRAQQLREVVPAGAVPVRFHFACLFLQQLLLNRLSRHNERLVVCGQMLALSKAHSSGDEYVSQIGGVPWSMFQLAQAYYWVGRRREGREMARSALQLYQGYCQRQRDDVPLTVRRMMGKVQRVVDLHPAESLITRLFSTLTRALT